MHRKAGTELPPAWEKQDETNVGAEYLLDRLCEGVAFGA